MSAHIRRARDTVLTVCEAGEAALSWLIIMILPPVPDPHYVSDWILSWYPPRDLLLLALLTPSRCHTYQLQCTHCVSGCSSSPVIIIYIIFLSVFMSVDFDWLKRKLLSICFSHCGIIRSVTLLHTAYLCFVWWLNTKYRDLFVNWSFCLLFLFQQILFKSNQDLHQLVFVGLRDTTILGFIISSFIFWPKNLCKWRLL